MKIFLKCEDLYIDGAKNFLKHKILITNFLKLKIQILPYIITRHVTYMSFYSGIHELKTKIKF